VVTRSPLYVASLYGQLQTVKFLYELGASVNGRTRDNATPLYVAAEFGRLQVDFQLEKCNFFRLFSFWLKTTQM
jgi:ankyrin repeat protein